MVWEILVAMAISYLCIYLIGFHFGIGQELPNNQFFPALTLGGLPPKLELSVGLGLETTHAAV